VYVSNDQLGGTQVRKWSCLAGGIPKQGCAVHAPCWTTFHSSMFRHTQVMHANGVTHLTVQDDQEGMAEVRSSAIVLHDSQMCVPRCMPVLTGRGGDAKVDSAVAELRARHGWSVAAPGQLRGPRGSAYWLRSRRRRGLRPSPFAGVSH
jgi:hypothetical protein